MAHDYARNFYTSAAWKRTREAYIAYRRTIDGGVCEACRQRMGEIVHHRRMITPENINNPEVTLSFSNLELLCQECHNAMPGHAFGHGARHSRVVFDYETGEPVGLRDEKS